jgi:hypothetical protein
MLIFKKLSQRKADLVFVVILVLAAGVYLYNLRFSDLWVDETFSKALAQKPLWRMRPLLAGDFHPPLYFLGLKLWMMLVGPSATTLRLFSVMGALSILIVGYVLGRRVFGDTAALCYCGLLLCLPMIATYSHAGRMYTWAACIVTGVFLSACRVMQSGKLRACILLGLFSAMAAYTHYYALMAAFWANLFVLVYLLLKRDKAWHKHALVALTAAASFLPWLLVLVGQARSVQRAFYIAPPTAATVLGCLTDPFAQNMWGWRPSIPMIVITYGLGAWVGFGALRKRSGREGAILGLATTVFVGTLLTALVLSLTVRPILMSRYMMSIVTLLMVAPALYFAGSGNRWVKYLLGGVLLCCGIYTALAASYVSMGPYGRAVAQLQKDYPEIKKVFHTNELTPGPLLEFTPRGALQHYLLANERTITFTNMDVFDELSKVKSLKQALAAGERFCLVVFENVPLNQSNVDLILSSSRSLATERVIDRKGSDATLALHILEYQ